MLNEAPPQVVPVLSRPMDTQSPMQIRGVTIRPARMMDAPTARSTLSRVIADVKTWTADFPHEVHGEAAYVLGFFRGLVSRQRTLTDATLHGQPVEPDAIAEATHLPPAESVLLGDLALQAREAMQAYSAALRAAGLTLTGADEAKVNALNQTVESILG